MTELMVSSYSEICDYIKRVYEQGPNSGDLFYRGICGEYRLLPSIAYDWVGVPVLHIEELSGLAQSSFDQLIESQNLTQQLTDYQLRFLGRHFGLVSTYIDITFDITVALQFGIEAAENKKKPDASFPLHLYCIDGTEIERIEQDTTTTLDKSQLAILRPKLILESDNPSLIGERTQTIQCARLLYQPIETLLYPLDETYPNKLLKFIISPDKFSDIKKEIEQTGTSMTTDLLIQSENPIFNVVRKINSESVNEIKAKYKI